MAQADNLFLYIKALQYFAQLHYVTIDFDLVREQFRAASRSGQHPDKGGDNQSYQTLVAYKEIIEKVGNSIREYSDLDTLRIRVLQLAAQKNVKVRDFVDADWTPLIHEVTRRTAASNFGLQSSMYQSFKQYAASRDAVNAGEYVSTHDQYGIPMYWNPVSNHTSYVLPARTAVSTGAAASSSSSSETPVQDLSSSSRPTIVHRITGFRAKTFTTVGCQRFVYDSPSLVSDEESESEEQPPADTMVLSAPTNVAAPIPEPSTDILSQEGDGSMIIRVKRTSIIDGLVSYSLPLEKRMPTLEEKRCTEA
jgi:hypothetical protein